MLRLATSLLFLLICFGASAQYVFESKKAEKLYQKLEEYYAEGSYDKILENEADIQSLFLTKKDTLGALMYSFLGESYLYYQNDLNKSLEMYQQELALRKTLNVEGNDWRATIFNIGYIMDELGQYKETEALYLELMAIEEKEFGVKSKDYYTTAYNLGNHYMYVEDHINGLEIIKKLRKSVDKGSFEDAMVTKLAGDLYEISGSYAKSEKALVDALGILEQNGLTASIEYASTLNSLGGLYVKIGKIPQAEEIYSQAISIINKLPGDNTDYSSTLNGNLALNYLALGNFEKAEEILLSNLKIDKEYYGETSYIYAVDAGNLALNYMYWGKYTKAEEYLLLSGSVYKEIVGEESIEYGRSLQSLVYVYTKYGELEKAKATGLEAVKIMTKAAAGNNYQISFPNYNLGDAYFAAGDVANAEKYHATALTLREKSVGTAHPDYAKSATKMAILNWRKNNVSMALSFYNQTFDNYFKQIDLIFPILSEEEKTKFYYNQLRPAFEQFNSFVVETSSENKALIGQMYDYQLATKGLILYATNKVREAIIASGDSVLINKYNIWIGQKEQLAKLFSATDIALAVRNKKIDSLSTLSNDLEKDLSKTSSVFAENIANRKITWKDVKGTLKPGEAAVEIIRFRDFTTDSAGVFTDEVYYAALIVRPDSEEFPELVLMRNGKLMETRYLSNYRNAIKYKIDEDYSYRLFWRPIANKLEGVKKVYFSPDGVFNQISIYTLRNSATGNFTLDELEIQLVSNTKDLVAVNTLSPNKSGSSFLFGYPNYNMGYIDEQNATSPASTGAEERGVSRGVSRGAEPDPDFNATSLSRGGSIPRGLRGNMLRYMRSNQLLGLLPGTKREVNLIDSLYRIKNVPVKTLMSNVAVEDSLKNAQSPKVLHIATHGFFLESAEPDDESADEYVENPLLRSGLILAGANSFIRSGKISESSTLEDDGILTAYEAMNLNLDQTELVVLSACETGLGEVKNGEGVYGLQRAFQVAGADAIIMSMWTVDDDATQELMTNFYKEWLTTGDKHKAFINAQKQLKAKWKSPYYWGAFVMIGR